MYWFVLTHSALIDDGQHLLCSGWCHHRSDVILPRPPGWCPHVRCLPHHLLPHPLHVGGGDGVAGRVLEDLVPDAHPGLVALTSLHSHLRVCKEIIAAYVNNNAMPRSPMTRYLWSSGVTGAQAVSRPLLGGVGSPTEAKLIHISSMASLTFTMFWWQSHDENVFMVWQQVYLGSVHPVDPEINIPELPQLIRVSHSVLCTVHPIGIKVSRNKIKYKQGALTSKYSKNKFVFTLVSSSF